MEKHEELMTLVFNDAGDVKGKVFYNAKKKSSSLELYKPGDALVRIISSEDRGKILELFWHFKDSKNSEKSFNNWVDKIGSAQLFKDYDHFTVYCICLS